MCLCLPVVATASGHGPVYGLATPTLGEGAWSLDTAAMYRLGSTPDGDGSHALMFRPMLGYGIHEDLQISASIPMPLYATPRLRSPRVMAMMPANPDAELLLSWRFHRQGTNVGARFESTALVGFDYPTDAVRAGVATSPGITFGAVTGYASRTIYAWAGALYRRYMAPVGGDRPGDTILYSLVLGYRPPFFQEDYPAPDWRIFLEAVGEHTGPDIVGGVALPNTGGHEVLIGPTLLGLYGSWGISGGPMFPVYTWTDGPQPVDTLRFVVNLTHWF